MEMGETMKMKMRKREMEKYWSDKPKILFSDDFRCFSIPDFCIAHLEPERHSRGRGGQLHSRLQLLHKPVQRHEQHHLSIRICNHYNFLHAVDSMKN